MLQLDFCQHMGCIEKEFTQPSWDAKSGLAIEELESNCRQLFDASAGQPLALRRAELIAYVLGHARIAVEPFEYFADQLQHRGIALRIARDVIEARLQTLPELQETDLAGRCRAYTGERDFGHTCPDWQALLALGYPGILARLRAYRGKAQTQEQVQFYDAGILVYEAVLRLIERMAVSAERLPGDHGVLMAQNLRGLTKHAPRTFYEALQFTLLVYWTQSAVEGATIRSLGRFDLLLQPYYEQDLRQGTATEAELKELLRYYFYRWNAANITANIPITLCGLTAKDRDAASDFTRAILDVYGGLNIISPKFHIRMNAHTPADIPAKVCDMIRRGTNSFVFCNDAVVIESMVKLGEAEKDARNYVMVGCYESTAMGKEIACTTNGRVSFSKAVEYAMSGGTDLVARQQVGLKTTTDFRSFEDFMQAVEGQLAFLCRGCMKRIAAIESMYPAVYNAPLFSASFLECVQSGRDAYNGGVRYSHSSINVFGIATAVDALAAVEELVFKRRMLTLAEFVEVLKNNWAGAEKLQLICKKQVPKFGNNNPVVDQLAARLMRTAAACINGQPNGRSGAFRLGSFSIDWRFEFGEHTAASADGRMLGETLSKNLSASLGMDREGATALILSAAAIDYTQVPNGAVLDLLLHRSAAEGADGLEAMLGLLKTFLQHGGMALQCNIMDEQTLRRAQQEPQKYANLQVRLCGWNVLFVNLSKKEQDELIMQTTDI